MTFLLAKRDMNVNAGHFFNHKGTQSKYISENNPLCAFVKSFVRLRG